jgi:hypothetical protein
LYNPKQSAAASAALSDLNVMLTDVVMVVDVVVDVVEVVDVVVPDMKQGALMPAETSHITFAILLLQQCVLPPGPR